MFLHMANTERVSTMARQFERKEPTLSKALRQKARALELEIRQRKRMEDALREAERRRDEFLATLAHELRNPLAPIRNAAEIMKVADSDPARMAAARTLIERHIAHLVRLIDDLLDLSRITRGRLELRTQPTDLVDVLDLALETTRPLLDRKGQHLRVHISGAPLELNGDPTRLAQVIATLIDNASTYSDPGSPIDVSLTAEGAEAVIRVSDRGVGITPELLPWVFDMFARPTPTNVGARSGLGIGLTLVKRLVDLHGGHVEAHSEGLNRGSTFTVRLPLARSLKESTPGLSTRPAPEVMPHPESAMASTKGC
jgi:signal transduction histidine kinase